MSCLLKFNKNTQVVTSWTHWLLVGSVVPQVSFYDHMFDRMF